MIFESTEFPLTKYEFELDLSMTTCKFKKGCYFKDTIYPGIFNKLYVFYYNKLS